MNEQDNQTDNKPIKTMFQKKIEEMDKRPAEFDRRLKEVVENDPFVSMAFQLFLSGHVSFEGMLRQMVWDLYQSKSEMTKSYAILFNNFAALSKIEKLETDGTEGEK